MIVDKYGTRMWYRNGKLHRTLGPAVEYSDGTRWWYRNGKRHRTDGPAVERNNGDRAWWLNGKLHRVDGPAIVYADGTRLWYLNDERYNFREWLKHNTALDSKKRIILMLQYSKGVAA